MGHDKLYWQSLLRIRVLFSVFLLADYIYIMAENEGMGCPRGRKKAHH